MLRQTASNIGLRLWRLGGCCKDSPQCMFRGESDFSVVLPSDKQRQLVVLAGVDEKRYREIYIKNNDVFILSNYWDRPLKVWPYSETLFLIEENDTRSNLQLIFQFDNNGKVVSLKTRGLNSGRLGEANIKE